MISNEISKCHISAKMKSKLEIDFTFTMKPYMNFHLALFLKKFPRLVSSSHWTFNIGEIFDFEVDSQKMRQKQNDAPGNRTFDLLAASLTR